jgi:hypothetical protein
MNFEKNFIILGACIASMGVSRTSLDTLSTVCSIRVNAQKYTANFGNAAFTSHFDHCFWRCESI